MLKCERLRILLETCTVFAISTQTKSSTTCHAYGVKYTQKVGEEIICHLTECKIVVYVLTLVDNIRLQVVGELIIKNSKPLSVTASFCPCNSTRSHTI